MGVLGLMLLIYWVCNFIGMIFPNFRMSLRLHGSNKFLLFFIFLYYFVDRPSPVQAPNGVPIYRTDRGGEVTYHGPGQLVVYPILDLRRQPYQKDLHWYLRCMEEVIIRTLAVYDIVGVRDEINTGVWVGDEKIAAVGVSSSRWITTHGFSLNVNPDMSFFDTSFIIPCGIEERGVTSIFKIFQEQGKLASSVPSLQQISEVVLMCFNDTFGVFTKSGRKLS